MGEEIMKIFKWQSKTGDYKVLQRDGDNIRVCLTIYNIDDRQVAKMKLLKRIEGSILWRLSPVRKEEYEEVKCVYINYNKAIKI